MRKTMMTMLLVGCSAGQDTATAPEAPQILSAYLGIQDANAATSVGLSQISGCPQEAGDEGMPVVFSVPVDPDTLDPEDFTVTLAAGATATPGCATLAPADEADEGFTVLLTGALGSSTEAPAGVSVSGALSGAAGEDLSGLSIEEITTVEEGPGLVLAIADPAAEACAEAGATLEVQTTWQGGVSGPLGAEPGEAELAGLSLIDADGGAHLPLGFDDLGDNDNHLVLCVPSGVEPVEVSAAAGVLFDPTNNPNPPTTSAVQERD